MKLTIRKVAALVSLILSLVIHLHIGTSLANPLVFGLGVAFTAFLQPAVVIVIAADLLGYRPFTPAHEWLTWIMLIWVAALFWWFIGARAKRAAGIFDPFDGSSSKRPRVRTMIASVFDALGRRRFGREKTGRWA